MVISDPVQTQDFMILSIHANRWPKNSEINLTDIIFRKKFIQIMFQCPPPTLTELIVFMCYSYYV